MIKEVTMYAAFCDNCGEQFNDEYTGYAAMTDEFSMQDFVSNDDTWYTGYKDDIHYCSKCFTYDDDGEPVLNKVNE